MPVWIGMPVWRGRPRPRILNRFQPRAIKKASRPTKPCDGPRMNPSVDVGRPPRPFRHLRMAQRRSPDPSSSRAPVHSALVQKSVTAITNPAGRLSCWMLGKSRALGKWKTAKSWQAACYQSNPQFTNGTCQGGITRAAIRQEELESAGAPQTNRPCVFRPALHPAHWIIDAPASGNRLAQRPAFS
jgi:hypothetical protein